VIPRLKPEYSFGELAASLFRRSGDCAAAIASELGRNYVLWAPSGRAGLCLALQACQAQHAIVPAFNCWAVMEALQVAGVQPRFVDIGIDLNAKREDTLTAITQAPPHTALLLTHQFGIPVEGVSELLALAKQHDVTVIEDGAAALGAHSDAGPVGSVGDISVLSFQYTKTVLAGDGGLVLADRRWGGCLEKLARRFQVRTAADSLRLFVKLTAIELLTAESIYPWTVHPLLRRRGTTNQRDTAIDDKLFTALPSEWMRQLAAQTWSHHREVLRQRRALAKAYLEALRSYDVITYPQVASSTAAPIRFPVLVNNRSQVIEACARRGLDLGRSFTYVCSDGPGYPQAERVAHRIVNLPLTAKFVRRIDDVLAAFTTALSHA
jgi:dTDP-4-amino-4,6-dideoxygalactose transaminase